MKVRKGGGGREKGKERGEGEEEEGKRDFLEPPLVSFPSFVLRL